MIITRTWAMPNRSTFSIKPIGELIERYINGGMWIDPFAGGSPFNARCIATNDLSLAAITTHHLESLEFLQLQPDASCDGVLFDPPYSPRQIAEPMEEAELL